MKQLLKSLFLSIGILPVLLLATGGIASAHVLKENNGISGVLHIPPEDNPEAGQPTELDESFGDSNSTFSLGDCNCKVVVTSNGKAIQTTTLAPQLAGATLDTVATVNFPAIGVYDVIISGSAKDGAFHSFSLDYLVRVPTAVGVTPQTNGQGLDVAIIGGGSLVVLLMFGVTMIQRGGRYAKLAPTISKPKIKTKKTSHELRK
jgi:hypothetical protein